MTRLSALPEGAIFRSPSGTRRWRVDKKFWCAVSGDYVRAIALDPPERNDGRGLPDGTNEVNQGERDYWSSLVNVEECDE